ncbi:hypothetical protein DFQ27_006409, partial [Actinomortierella ambigua]
MKAAAVNIEVGHHQSKLVVEPDEDETEDGDEHESEDLDEDEAEVENEAKAEAEAEAEAGSEDDDGGSADEADEDFFNDEEMSSLLANIAKAQHPTCMQYQRECIQALQDNRLRKADIADVIMGKTFEPRILSQLVISPDLPDPGVDDAAIIKAVR